MVSNRIPQFSGVSLKISTDFLKFHRSFPQIRSFCALFSVLIFVFLANEVGSEPQTSFHSGLYQSEQILLILGEPGETQGELHLYGVEEGEWKLLTPVVTVWFGRSGLIPADEKREGDGFTPYGSYPIRRILGKEKKSIPKLEYTQIQKNDYWSDVPSSKHYNQLIRKKEKGATPLWNSSIYQLFIVIEHNTNPSIPGHGSMIFIHPWEETKPTSGCVGVKLVDLQAILQHLDGSKNPFILIIASDENN
ncbi:MAG: L,D-transpeptidase family protein [Leptospira sp.]|uniref:L,D-transpeptidase family protein n=1 Tax=Leptospira sp. TaxID=178 RepID=UPI0025C25CE3|nr:L,D-transpeptidase family protein [Leptospira sp.]MBL0956319.1 L,D-transpeptidase family protein [Leptospira sp.]